MKVRILGFQELDFTTENGDKLVGTNLYFAYKQEGVEGEVAEKRFIKKELIPAFKAFKKLLKPFGIKKFYSDNRGFYSRNLNPKTHTYM